jgi:alkanesulfonate monooxygenase SsuD/methylene tetrahydromethanopterin reductase-like flavin-dependent oxidoreductase (luciferase family)
MKPQVDAYKKGIAECTELVGDYVNDNVMLTNSVICFKDRDRAREAATRWNRSYVFSLVCLYHDTFPKPPGVPVWPDPPLRLKPEDVEPAIKAGTLLCGTPEDVCEQLQNYVKTGVDQVVFGVPNHLSPDETIECLEMFGKQVIPEFDRDPVHSTTHYRDAARKWS